MNFPCIFCQTDMSMDEKKPSEWVYHMWHCSGCRISYNFDKYGATIHYFNELSHTRGHVLSIDFMNNETALYYIDQNNPPPETLLIVPYMIQGVTPTNLKDKIKTLLTFS